MNKIEVGEYVRTLDGNIGKIEQINKEPTDDNVIYVVTDSWVGMYEEIVKHSFNIIDLIEEGDYVNGMELFEFDDDETGELYLGFPIYDDGQMDCIEEVRPLNTIEIKSIVTKEQFERMEYKVNE